MSSENSDPVTSVVEVLEADAERALAYGDEALQFGKNAKPPPAKKPTLMDKIEDMAKTDPALAPLKNVVFKEFSELRKSKKPLVQQLTDPTLQLVAWTMSSSVVFMNAPYILKVAQSEKRPFEAVVKEVLEHEALHVTQFAKTGQPTSFKDMLKFECDAYRGGATCDETLRIKEFAVAEAEKQALAWFIKHKFIPGATVSIGELYDP